MINVATTPPPEHIEINGTPYAANVDFRVWAEIMTALQMDMYDDPKDDDEIVWNMAVAARVQQLAFGAVVPEPVNDTLAAMLEFMGGYPREINEYKQDERDDGSKLFSLKHDMNYIVLAIRNQSGIDLTYTRSEPFHWWLFLLEFQTLSEQHVITNIMKWRGYDGDNKDMIKLRNSVALPQELTKSEQAMLEQLDEMFPDT